MNRDHSVIFKIAPTYCSLGSSVDYEAINVKLKTIKTLEIKARENLYDVELGRDYLDKH